MQHQFKIVPSALNPKYMWDIVLKSSDLAPITVHPKSPTYWGFRIDTNISFPAPKDTIPVFVLAEYLSKLGLKASSNISTACLAQPAPEEIWIALDNNKPTAYRSNTVRIYQESVLGHIYLQAVTPLPDSIDFYTHVNDDDDAPARIVVPAAIVAKPKPPPTPATATA